MLTAVVGAVGAAVLLARPPATRDPASRSEASTRAAGVLADLSSVDYAARIGDGWVIVDGREKVLHITDSSGNVLRQIGRRGRGPGEFEYPQLVAVTDSLIYVAQLGRPELSAFDYDGHFVRQVPATAACGTGALELLAAAHTEVVAVRRCLEPPRRMRLQLERLIDGSLQPWGLADTIPFAAGGFIPMTYPLLALDDRRVLFGDGGTGCVRSIDLATSAASGATCLDWLPRLATPDSIRQDFRARTRGRVQDLDSLPRVLRIALLESALVTMVPIDPERFQWLRIDAAVQSKDAEPLGRPWSKASFLHRNTQLIVTEDDDGIHLEVIRVRP
jgi:hypothetical protein